MVEEGQPIALAGAEYAVRRLIHNERVKLLANALYRASAARFTVGIATPVTSYLYGLGRAGLEPWFLLAAWWCLSLKSGG